MFSSNNDFLLSFFLSLLLEFKSEENNPEDDIEEYISV